MKLGSRSFVEMSFVEILMNRAAGPLGTMAATFRVERWGRREGWLAVLFHHVTDGSVYRTDDPLTAGLGVDMALPNFEAAIEHILTRYRAVTLDEALHTASRRRRDRPPVLLCFDDAYASVARLAAPVLRKHDVPWVFFVNPGLVNGKSLGLDNLLAYVTNTAGLPSLARTAKSPATTLAEFIARDVAAMNPAERRGLAANLCASYDIDAEQLARSSQLYVTTGELRDLAGHGVEIGNHTRDHVHCRSLGPTDIRDQIEDSADQLREMVGTRVRSFAFPYGSRDDATLAVGEALSRSGHECAFLVHGRPNDRHTPVMKLHRVSTHADSPAHIALELGVLPLLRQLVATQFGRPRATT